MKVIEYGRFGAAHEVCRCIEVDVTIAAPIEASYGLDDIGDAHAHAAREGRAGKILLTPNGPIR